MASRSIPIPFRKSEQTRTQTMVYAPSLRTAVIAFIAVLILFRWLHLILALQIAGTGRQIQAQTDQLHQLERQNASLLDQASLAQSPQDLADRAEELGYRSGTPVYLTSDKPLATATDSGQEAAVSSPPGLAGTIPGLASGDIAGAPLAPEQALVP